jgi:RecA-family ATPase/5S rRNA maturation endonuclease (ribonuclease M5)
MDKNEIKRRVSIEQVLDYYGRQPDAKGKFQCLFPMRHNNGDVHHSGRKKDGRVYCDSQTCFGEKGADIFEVVGLMEGITDFAAQKAKIEEMFNLKEQTRKRTIVQVYDYKDETGAVLFQTVRYDPKDFRQRRPDGKGGWIRNLEGVRLVLYRLPELVHAEFVLNVEGEKDVEAAYALGLPQGYAATTSPMGAGKWKPEYTEALREKSVIICPDQDETGRKHGKQIAEALNGIAHEVLWLDLPQEKDLSAWVEVGGTAQEFEVLLQNAQPWQSSMSVQEKKFRFTSMADLLAEPEEETDWLVENLLPMGGLSVIGGKPKAGKSTTVRNLCLSVARGEPFLGFPTTQGPVLYCAFEEKRGEVTKHFRQLGALPDDPILSFVGRAPDEFIAKLWPALHEIKPALIILDTLVKVAHVTDMNDYSQVMKAIDPFLHMARESGAHLLLVHHAGKGDRSGGDALLGSTGIFATVDTCLIQKRSDKYRTIESINRYGTDIEETVLEWHEDTRSISLGGTKKETDVVRVKEEIKAFLKGQETPVSRETLEEAVEGKTGNKRQALKTLVESKEVERSGKGKSGDPFMYRLASPDQGRNPEEMSCSLVPSIYGEQENNTSKNDESPHEQKAMSCSQDLPLFAQQPDSQEQVKPEVFDLVD